MQTWFITGANGGLAYPMLEILLERGDRVAATVRKPHVLAELQQKYGSSLWRANLDLTDSQAIQQVVDQAIEDLGAIDILVNNAGYAVYGPFETTTSAQLQREYDTNVFGLMAMTRAFLPVFRRQKSGTLINVASMGGRFGFPLYSIYNSTKWAVEGFSEALMYELKPLNIKVRLIEPGVIKTDFYDRSLDRTDDSGLLKDYGRIIQRARKSMSESAIQRGTEPITVASEIYRAATDTGWRLRYPVGMDAKLVSFLQWLLPESLFYRVLEKATLE